MSSIFDEPVFKKGDIAICVGSRGYHLTTGKEYVIKAYDKADYMDNFTWPAYVVVEDDYGNGVYCHASRFKLKETNNVINK